MAAGDDDDGNDGHMIFADLPSAGRQFRVVVGWPAQRSLDAQQSDGVAGDDTVITRVDRKHLWSQHAEAFKDHGSLFALAKVADLSRKAAEREQKARLSQSTSALCVPAVLPATRPYYG